MTERDFLIARKQAEREMSKIVFDFEAKTGAKINDIRVWPHGNIKDEDEFRNIATIRSRDTKLDEFNRDLLGGESPEGMIGYNAHKRIVIDNDTFQILFENGNLYTIKDYIIVKNENINECK
jgi:hypothetical protein